jgi:phage head maturation protease
MKNTHRQAAKAILSQNYERKLEFQRAEADDENLTIPASISSETPYYRQMFFGPGFNEVLLHGDENIDLERAAEPRGLPLLKQHDDGQLIGRMHDVQIRDNRLVGVMHFSPNTQVGREAYADTRDGFLTDTSIRYQILDFDREALTRAMDADDDADPVTVEVTRWALKEGSIVSVPADNSVGVNRSDTNEEITMDKTTTKKGGNEGGGSTVANFEAAREDARRAGLADGLEKATERVSKIIRMFSRYEQRDGVRALMETIISDPSKSVADANEDLLNYLAGEPEPAAPVQRQAPDAHGQRHIETVADESDKWEQGVTEALMARSPVQSSNPEIRAAVQKDARQNEFYSMRLDTIARDYLERNHAFDSKLDRMGMVGQAFTRAGMHSTSDFANILGNVANKQMLLGYDEAEETWRRWCRVGNLSDFKVADRVNISSFSDLELILEGGEYKEGHLSDLKEQIQLAKYGKTFHITREAIINDDMQAFTVIPNGMGRAAARTVGDIAYLLLTSNPTLNQDGTALFHANHNNLGTGGAITEARLDELGVLAAAQTSPAPGTGETGATLNINLRKLLIPRALDLTAQKAVRTPTGPDTAGDLTVNTQTRWEITWDQRLDADSATAYYGLADPFQHDTFEIAFLDGRDEPTIESQDGWTIDGTAYKVRLEAAGAALDFRGVTKNAGV